ncbi:MAG: hypothetical protein Q9222_000295 [Ikaeria aurantiellina]
MRSLWNYLVLLALASPLILAIPQTYVGSKETARRDLNPPRFLGASLGEKYYSYSVPGTTISMVIVLAMHTPIERAAMGRTIFRAQQELRRMLENEGNRWLDVADDPYQVDDRRTGKCMIGMKSVHVGGEDGDRLTYRTVLDTFQGLWDVLYLGRNEYTGIYQIKNGSVEVGHATNLKDCVNQNQDHALQLLNRIASASGPMVQIPRGPLLIFIANVISLCSITPFQAGDGKLQDTMATVNGTLSEFHNLIRDMQGSCRNCGKCNERKDAVTQSPANQTTEVTQTAASAQGKTASQSADPHPLDVENPQVMGREDEQDVQVPNPVAQDVSDQQTIQDSQIAAIKGVGPHKEGSHADYPATQLMIDPLVQSSRVNDGGQNDQMEGVLQGGDLYQGEEAIGAHEGIIHPDSSQDEPGLVRQSISTASISGSVDESVSSTERRESEDGESDSQDESIAYHDEYGQRPSNMRHNPAASAGKAAEHRLKKVSTTDNESEDDSSDPDDSSVKEGSSADESESIAEEEQCSVEEEVSVSESTDSEDEEETTPDTSMSERADASPEFVHKVEAQEEPTGPFPMSQCMPQPTAIPRSQQSCRKLRVRITNREIAMEVAGLGEQKLKQCLEREIRVNKARVECAKVMPTGEIRITAADAAGAEALRHAYGWRRDEALPLDLPIGKAGHLPDIDA